MGSGDKLDECVWPERLFHYTNLESLALILRNRTIRFMPLTSLDDPQEAVTSDVVNLGRFFFVSCWTDDSDESIPMWNMYASLNAGVRISLPPMPFLTYPLTKEGASRVTGIPPERVEVSADAPRSYMPFDDLANGLLSPSFFNGKQMLKKVEYTSDKEKLEPKVYFQEVNNKSLNFGLFGCVKNERWKFQNEWRYLVNILPLKIFDNLSDISIRSQELFERIRLGVQEPPCPYYDFRLDPDMVSQMEIVASPRMSAGNIALLEILLDKHGLSSHLRQSELTGLL